MGVSENGRVNEELGRLLAVRDGLFTTAMAARVGIDDWNLSAAVRRGTIRRVTRGVYAAPLAGSARTAEQVHGELCRAALLVHPTAALTSSSAVLAHGLPVLDAALGRVHLQRSVRQQVRTQDFVIRPGALPTTETGLGDAVEMPWAIIQTAMDHGLAHGLVAADAALHAGQVSDVDVAGWCSLVRGWPRSGRVRTLAAFADARTESPGESLTRLALRLADIEAEPQVVVADPRTGEVVARVDFMVKNTNVIVEFDGKVKYAEGDPDVLFKEKKREDRLRALGFIVVRITWADLLAPGRVVAKVRSALRLAA